ncbi:MAG: tail-specific protease [Ignavibacteria bacterium CG2_30_36_16]|nr:tail-specific protease [Ignavibacteria bacterium]OIP56943.1 MAG: tail-specific protease [Ignavibacteria bacterium CG2_30_36_16]
MKKFIIALVLLTAVSFFLATSSGKITSAELLPDSVKTLEPLPYHSQEEQLISTILSRYHYQKFKLDDSLSGVIFDRYLKTLDGAKSYFTASDINDLEKYRYSFDDNINEGNLEPAYKIFNLFRDRLRERIKFIDKLLDNEFDYTQDEVLIVDRENSTWAADNAELNELWRKRIKNDALSRKLNGETWDKIASNLKKRYQNFERTIIQYNSEDVFQLVMNAYTESIDPHSNYLSPITSDNFKIDMTRSLEGIGAQLQTEDEYTKVAEIIVGGPAHKAGELKRDDRIIGVAQGEDGEMADVIGKKINDVVSLIRGKKGTTVRLQILPAADGVNAVPKEIIIVRERIKLEEQSAKKEIINIENRSVNYSLGVISIPAFYLDYEGQQKGLKDFKTTTGDVRKLLKELKEEKVDGVIIDLRNNGGGSLNEAIELTGLFIKDGPVVQVKNSDGVVDVADDPDPDEVYSGPLAVLVNRFSASASEIFAGAIQDYQRGIIIGEQTFGKGTVQNLIDLNRLMRRNDQKMGQVKLTIAKYYRITGGSTQHLGVVPHIEFPSAFDAKEFGESAQPNALPWDQIAAADYKLAGQIENLLQVLLNNHNQRMAQSAEYSYLIEDINEYKEQREKKTISLNEEVRKKEKEDLEENRFQRENERRKIKGIKLLDKGEKIPPADEKDDFLLNEAGHILIDLIKLSVG